MSVTFPLMAVSHWEQQWEQQWQSADILFINFAAMAAGICSGFVTAILQTKLGVDSLLAGIIVNTALYSVNIAVMGGSSLINMNRTETVFSMMKETLKVHR